MSRLGSLPVIQALEDGDRWPPDNLVSQAHHISELLTWARKPASRNKTNSSGFLTSIFGFHVHAHTSKHSAYTHMCTHKGKFFLQKFFAYLLSSFPFTAIYIISISGNNLVYCKQKTLEWKPCIYYFQNNLGTSGRLFSARAAGYYWFVSLLNTQHKRKGLLGFFSKLLLSFRENVCVTKSDTLG